LYVQSSLDHAGMVPGCIYGSSSTIGTSSPQTWHFRTTDLNKTTIAQKITVFTNS
jgi:hypothetical protein